MIALNESSMRIQGGRECWSVAKMLEKQHEQAKERVTKKGQAEASGEAPDRVHGYYRPSSCDSWTSLCHPMPENI